MATNVCICSDNLEVDGSGRLCVKHDASLVDGANGLKLPVMAVHDHDSGTYNTDFIVPTAGVQVSPTLSATITNPSTVRSMLVRIEQQDTVSVGVGDNDRAYLYQHFHDNGGALQSALVESYPINTDGAIRSTEGNHHYRVRYVTIAPGATWTTTFFAYLDSQNGVLTGIGRTTSYAATVILDLVGIIL